VKPTIWHGCYDKSLKGFITDQSFGHPAKYSLGLIERIFDHCLQRGYLKRGDLVGDVFGGVAIGGLVAAYRGLRWLGCELEPRFVGWSRANIELHRTKLEYLGCPLPVIVQGDSRKFAERVQAIVSSPPYSETLSHGGGPDTKHDLLQGGKSLLAIKAGYGETNGNIGSCPAGVVEAVVSSPPYNLPMSQDHNGKRGGKRGTKQIEPGAFAKYGNTEGQIEGLQQGKVAAVVSSPPYSDIAAGAGGLNTKPAKHNGQQSGRSAKAASQDADQKYGTSDGQISRLKVGAVVTSPPFEDCKQGTSGTLKEMKTAWQRDPKNFGKPGHRPAQMSEYNCNSMNDEYGNTEGQIGNAKGETYWQAMDQVYRSCFQAIRPGGVLVLVVKDYCKGGKRVRLCDDTMRLCEHIGFQPLERIHAMLVSETVEAGLFGEEKTKRQRKSFFRRLYEAGIPDGDERRIDHEEVLILTRP
jgi:DNA modification methylase